ncbi:putative cytochrome P450 [Macrophomina phaseolina]|uniref:Cytochrome P450 n=1 Tax=Macrophomina phaseolina TaxID=35725 RepID=A0ABQ8FW16_9PEZI|nr:putative cytochrome P450 [Macrophomina phaseolina]
MLDSMDSSTFVLVCALACAAAVLIAHRIPTRDPREPPFLGHKIPLIGHALGLIRHGQRYPLQLSAAHPELPIFTLDVLAAKFYVVNSPDLISPIQRNSRALSFEYFINLSASAFLGVKGPGMELLREEQKGGGGLGAKIAHAMNPTLLGDGLDRMNETMIAYLKTSIDQLGASSAPEHDLVAWCRHAITIAATDSAYGKLNPYKDPRLEEAFWLMEQNLEKFMTHPFPHLTAPKVFAARESLVRAFTSYYARDGLPADASAMVHARFATQHATGATLADTARLEAGMALGLLTNTVPAAFWTLYEICSRPELLADVRAEIAAHALRARADGVLVVDLAALRDECELLVSVFQEMLRTRSRALPMRMVYEDVLLNGKHLLKQGAIVQMPSPRFHRHEGVWGETSSTFNARRFARNGEGSGGGKKKMPGFLAFGISPSLCPGRHFATGEVLALVAMLLLRFDVVPAGGQGWEVGREAQASVAASFDLPAEAFRVRFEARKEYEGKAWAYAVTPGSGRFGLIVG